MMRAVRLDEVGPPENLKIVEKPIPEVGPDDVLIKVELAGLIFGDAEARRGTYFSKTLTPWFPGREAGGYIEAVGANVTQWKPGDRVIALILSLGCCAEYVLASTRPQTLPNGYSIPPADIIALPENVSFSQGLVYLVNFRLAHLLFHGSSNVPPGAAVLVQGASGGMGSMMTQLAHAQGSPVIATCRRTVEEDFLRSLGADHIINVTHTDYVAKVMEITDGKGVGYVFNGVGGDTLNTDVDVLAPFGELQAYGYVAGKTLFDVFRVAKCIALKTFSADDFFSTPMFPAATAAMQAWFASGPMIEAGAILPLDEVVEANRMLDRGDVLGKIALKP
ncbi:MAG: zinc-binding dehydrogenase [Caulobacteraceae bacterium]|nr:zinc-binding dehydrogenase [Caulobacteraceae bacterium]